MKTENKFFIFDQPEKSSAKRRVKSLIYPAYSAVKKALMNVVRPKNSTPKKYGVSICAIFKNEAKYLKEWITFHKIVGVEHFYMYNNNSEDNFAETLEPYILDGSVTLINWEKNQAQIEAYEHCITNYAKETDWLGFIDLDELVVPIKDDTIGEFLSRFKNRPSVLVYWKMFGTSGYVERDCARPVSEDFTVCWNKHVNIGKCFYNTKYDYLYDSPKNCCPHHVLWAKKGKFKFPPVNEFDKVVASFKHKAKKEFPIQINHYFTKSYNEYSEKKQKGDVYFKLNPHDEQYFNYHEGKCSSVDYSAYKYLIKLKNELGIK